MKLSNQSALLFCIISLLLSCNHKNKLHTSKEPIIVKPSNNHQIDTIHSGRNASPNEEYNQAKIDSIKKNKVKPKTTRIKKD